MFLAFIDDSGRHDKKHQTFQVICTVLIRDTLFSHIEVNIGTCIESLIPEEKLEKFEEFHAFELYGGYGIFEGIDPDQRHTAIKRLLSMVTSLQIPVIYGAVNVPRLLELPYGSAIPADVAFRYCVPQISSQTLNLNSSEIALLIADDMDKGIKDRLKKTYRQLRKPIRPPEWEPGIWALHDEMYLGTSKDCIGIQIADLCGFFIAKHLEEDAAAEGFYNIFRQMIVASSVEPRRE